jgi:nucleotide-binding universal stress UspA family protein
MCEPGSITTNVVRRASRSVDLMVVGTSLRAGTRRLFLGTRVERMVTEAPCSTLILNVWGTRISGVR